MASGRLASNPELVLAEARLRAPQLGPGHLERPELVDRLGDASPARIRLLAAPAGYGKTSLLGEVARRSPEPVAWLTVDADLDRVDVLVRYLAAALGRVTAIDPDISFDPTAGKDSAGQILNRLTNSLAAGGTSFALVIDDAHRIRSGAARRALAAICRAVPVGSTVFLAARGAAPIPVAALRLDDAIRELGPDDLAFSPAEAAHFLVRSGIVLAPASVARLVALTEGWPAGLALALRAIAGSADPELVARAWSLRDHRAVEYFEENVLDGLDLDQRTFMTEASVLGRFSRGLARAALAGPGQPDPVDQARHDGLFLVPLDERHEWFRLTGPIAELLAEEAVRSLSPDRIVAIHTRAALAEEASGDFVSALAHARAAHDDELAAGILDRGAVQMTGRIAVAEVLDSVARLPPARLAGEPNLAITAALIGALGGAPAESRHYRLVAEGAAATGAGIPSGATLRARIFIVQSLQGGAGISGMTALAIEASELDPGGGPWRGCIELMRGASQALLGHPDLALARLELAADWLADVDPSTAVFATGYLALTALAAGEPNRAMASAQAALKGAEVLPAGDRAGTSLAALAASGLLAARRGQSAAALEWLRAAVSAIDRSAGLPWWSIQLRIELARLAIATGELQVAGTMLAAARRELLRFREAGILPQVLVQAERALALARRGEQMLSEPLTPAEWRVLDLLQTHLPIPEIADRLFVSRNTARTHVKALYEKLDAHSRSEAIERAFALKLLESPPPDEPR